MGVESPWTRFLTAQAYLSTFAAQVESMDFSQLRCAVRKPKGEQGLRSRLFKWEDLMLKQPKCGLILEQRSKRSLKVIRLNQNMLDVIRVSANRYRELALCCSECGLPHHIVPSSR